MRILVADDDLACRRLLSEKVAGWGHQVATAEDGAAAWIQLTGDPAIQLAILDWEMPGMTGIELCARIRRESPNRCLHKILCTGRDAAEDLIEALDAGADDTLTKPVDFCELKERVSAGARAVELQQARTARIAALQEVLAHARQRQEAIAMCMYCKSIRNDRNSWLRMEGNIAYHADVTLSHGVCEKCLEERFPKKNAT